MHTDNMSTDSHTQPNHTTKRPAIDHNLESTTLEDIPTQKSIESNTPSKFQKPPKFQKVVEGAYDLSLGISLIVAVALGFGIGYGLKKLTGISWFLWLGITWGVAAALLNIYKAYKRQQKELNELAKNPRYNAQKYLQDGDDEED